jgi:hypothetical protein
MAFAAGDLRLQAGHQVLRQDGVGARRERQAVARAPAVDALPPGVQP